MTKEREDRIRFIYAIVLSAFTVIVGILFIAQTWSIYRSAPQSPYTLEKIKAHFADIAVPVGIWLAAVVYGGVLHQAFPKEKQRPKPYIDVQATLLRVKKRLPDDERFQKEAFEVSKKQRRNRVIAYALGAFVLVSTATLTLGTMLDWWYLPIVTADFFAGHNAVVDRIFQGAILLIVGLTAVSVAAWWINRSRKTEYKCYLEIIATAKKEGRVAAATKGAEKQAKKIEGKGKTVLITRIGLAAIGVAFFVWGICNGGMQDVLLKAINICTQCIGLG